jgi:mannitol-1-phosphate 5-dehydrogenase
MPAVLGIDVGTTSTKVVLLKPDGSHEFGSWPSTEDLLAVWPQVKEWLAEHAGDRIGRLGITTHGPSAAVFRDDVLVGRIIPYHEKLPEGCEKPVANDHVLLKRSLKTHVPSRLAHWEREYGPLRKDDLAVQYKDVLNWQLAGVVARDSRSMRGHKVATCTHPEVVIGRVTEAGEALSGIPAGCEVICGCDDLTASVIGLSVPYGRKFNLANSTEHVGMVGNPPREGLCWLPPLGCRLPALCYASSATGGASLARELGATASAGFAATLSSELTADADAKASPQWKAVGAINEAIATIHALLPQDDAPVLMGGGLATIEPIARSRGSLVGAGQEVGALGVARLAARPLAVIFGAGKVGRGFLGQLLHCSGWRLHFVDSSEAVIQMLNRAGQYTVHNLGTGDDETIAGFSASVDDWRLGEADLIVTALGGGRLEEWAKSIAPRLDRPVDIVLAENHPAPAALVRSYVTSALVGVAQGQVLRSCIEPTPAQKQSLGPLTVQCQDHWTFPLDRDALVRPGLARSVAGFDLRPNFAVELTRKLYTYNAINAACSYLGKEKGYTWLSEAANDAEIAAVARAVGAQSSAALVMEHGFDPDDQARWCQRAMAKYEDTTITDPIERNARDPMRKLGRYERIMGPLMLCLKHRLPHDALLATARSALSYREPSDPAAVELARLVATSGPWAAMQQIADGLPASLSSELNRAGWKCVEP